MYLKKKTVFLPALLFILAALAISGCGARSTGPQTSAPDKVPEQPSSAIVNEAPVPEEKPVMRVGALKGPSSLGMLGLMDKNDKGETANMYEFTVEGAPADVQTKFLNGELDVIAIPTNMASVLYNKTGKDVSVIAVNTLGVLYVLSNGADVSSIKDLEGKTIYATAQGATPQYVLEHILRENGLDPEKDVKIEYKSEHSELAALMAAGKVELAMLPQPFVTTVTMKNPDVKIALDLNDEWRKASGGEEMTMTCIVASNKFLAGGRQAVDKFLDEYKQSTDFVNNNVDEAAALSQKYDIVPGDVAKLAIPKCGIVFIDGDGMKASVGPFIEVLFAADPASVGGSLPDDEFYYKK